VTRHALLIILIALADGIPVNTSKPPCEDYYEHNGRCYSPVIPGARREPTSEDP